MTLVAEPPARPCVYHITHVDNLPAILSQRALWSDARVRAQRVAPTLVGMTTIKQRRLTLPVHGHPGLRVGDCVPFYFCPRSVMLYILHRGNHPEITYRGGQDPIVHLEADLHAAVAHLGVTRRRWAFSLANAGARATEFRTDLDRIADIDWAAVQSTDFRDAAVKEAKQAEFLVEDVFEWSLVDRIGVRSAATRRLVEGVLATHGGGAGVPVVHEIPAWYY